MPIARQGMICGPVRSQVGEPVGKIVVGGGFNDGYLPFICFLATTSRTSEQVTLVHEKKTRLNVSAF